MKVLCVFENIKWTATKAMLRMWLHGKVRAAAEWSRADDAGLAPSSQPHGGEERQHLDMCEQRDMALKKASTIFGCDAPNSMSSLSRAHHPFPPVLRKRYLEAALSTRHMCPWKIGKWARVPDSPSVGTEDFRWDLFCCCVSEKVAHLGMSLLLKCINRFRAREMGLG